MDATVTIFIMLVTLLPLIIIAIFIPYLTRKTESFGVRIPSDVYHSPELQQMRKTYAYIMSAFSVPAFAIGLITPFFLTEEQTGPLVLILVLGYIVGGFAIYLPFHLRMKKWKAKHDWQEERTQTIVVDTNFRNTPLTYSNLWFALPFAIPVISYVLAVIYYPDLPEQLPVRFDMEFNAVVAVEKSYLNLLWLPLTQLLITGLMLFVNTIIATAKQQVDADRVEASLAQNRIFRRRWSAYIIGTTYLLVIMMSMIYLAMIIEMPPYVLLVATLSTIGVSIGWAVVLGFTTGQGGSRVNVKAEDDHDQINQDDDRYWKLGQFYFNPRDPAMFVEKRFGIGWTINLGRPLVVIIFFAVTLGIPLLLILAAR